MKRLSRRKALLGLGLGAAGAAAGAGAIEPIGATAAEPPAAANPPGACVLFPQAMEGPFYFDPALVRSDISEGRAGAPLNINLRVIESGSCTPITNARVDIWHADAEGMYSGYDRQGAANVSTKGQTFLRGTQTTDTDGRVSFRSIYPGWYPGRTPHIHVKVFLDANSLVTGQIYFPDDMTARIYKERAPYKDRGTPDTTNASDFIFASGESEGGGTVLSVVAHGETLVAALLIAVDKSGGAARKASGIGGWLRSLIGR